MNKTQDAFRTIGEVAEELDLPQHVLRFWETKFIQIRPVKRAGGRRYYRPEDVHLVSAIRVLLHSEGYTIKGVQRILREQGARAVVAASQGRRGPNGVSSVTPLHLVPAKPLDASLLDASLEGPFEPERAAAEAPGKMADLSTSLEAPAKLDALANAREAARSDPASAGSLLSPQDRHRMEAILAELHECARLLEEARRR